MSIPERAKPADESDESVNIHLHEVIKTRRSFLTNYAVSKLFYQALNHISQKWTLADQGLESSTESLHQPVRRSAAAGLTNSPFI